MALALLVAAPTQLFANENCARVCWAEGDRSDDCFDCLEEGMPPLPERGMRIELPVRALRMTLPPHVLPPPQSIATVDEKEKAESHIAPLSCQVCDKLPDLFPKDGPKLNKARMRRCYMACKL
jgi:hypothetical protein